MVYKILSGLFALAGLFMALQARGGAQGFDQKIWLALAGLCLLCFASARQMKRTPVPAAMLMLAAIAVFWTQYGLAVPALKGTGSNFGDLAWMTVGMALTVIMGVGALVSAVLARRRAKREEAGL